VKQSYYRPKQALRVQGG